MEEDILVQTSVGAGNHVQILRLGPKVQYVQVTAATGERCCCHVAVVWIIQVEVGAAEMLKDV